MVDVRSRSFRGERYEAKYTITEAQAAAVRRYCLSHLRPDPYSLGHPGRQYPVLSIYLDSPNNDLLKSTLSGRVRRYKLRVRTYRRFGRSASNGSAFFEIKRRHYGIVRKTRARTSSVMAESLVRQELAHFDLRRAFDTRSYLNGSKFMMLRNQIHAKPVVGVFYTREAYEGLSGNGVRITLDRNLHYGLLAPPGSGMEDRWCLAVNRTVILEVKFTDTYPFWVADMLRRVEVVRRGVCKYVLCLRAAGSPQLAAWGGSAV